MNFVVNFSDGISLTYQLIDDPIIDIWKQLITQRTIDDCCKINHFVGYATGDLIKQRIARLYELRDEINLYSERKIELLELNQENWLETMNRIHIHFPEMMSNPDFAFLHRTLSEYNDTIHWLESVFYSIWQDRRYEKTSLLRITLDVNKVLPTDETGRLKYPIPDESYKHFSPFLEFGDLTIHYAHVGKHAYEIFMNRDLDCPEDQFVPQHEFTGSVRMYFFDNFYQTQISKLMMLAHWRRFYDKLGGIDYWKIAFDDPRIAFGYLKIGKLSRITINGEQIAIPTTVADMSIFRLKLVDTHVIDWSIE
jgi:hypothetical protein